MDSCVKDRKYLAFRREKPLLALEIWKEIGRAGTVTWMNKISVTKAVVVCVRPWQVTLRPLVSPVGLWRGVQELVQVKSLTEASRERSATDGYWVPVMCCVHTFVRCHRKRTASNAKVQGTDCYAVVCGLLSKPHWDDEVGKVDQEKLRFVL